MSERPRPPVTPTNLRPARATRARRVGQAISIVSAVVVGLSWFRVVPLSAAWAAFLVGSIAGNQLGYSAPPNVTRISWVIWGLGMVLILAAYVAGAPIWIGLLGFLISVIGTTYYWFG